MHLNEAGGKRRSVLGGKTLRMFFLQGILLILVSCLGISTAVLDPLNQQLLAVWIGILKIPEVNVFVIFVKNTSWSFVPLMNVGTMELAPHSRAVMAATADLTI